MMFNFKTIVTYVAVAYLLITPGLFLYSALRRRTRRKALGVFAASRGYSFCAWPDSVLEDKQDDFELFRHAIGGWPQNHLRGNFSGNRIDVFDYRLTCSGKLRGSTIFQTVVVFTSNTRQLPHFRLRPVGLTDLIPGGHPDIDFSQAPEFSKHYHLSGTDEAQIRQAFQPSLLRQLGSNGTWFMEGHGERLLLYRQGQLVPADKMAGFIAETSVLASLL